MRSENQPVLTTRIRSPGSTRLATATSMARVPLPARMNGWLASSARQTWRMRSMDVPKASIRRGDVWPGGGADEAARTAGETSTGPGIINREGGVSMAAYGSRRGKMGVW
jgi:hypothetical protein